MNNGRRHSIKVKEKARRLRTSGLTHREIRRELGVSLGSLSLWVKDIQLTPDKKRSIELRRNKPSISQLKIETARKNFSKFWKPHSSDEELINRIRDFYSKAGRIPLKREFNNIYREYLKRFGGWNKAIELAGFKPHKTIFAKKHVAKDGHVCDSVAEKIIDDWFFKNKIVHRRNVHYPNSKMTADFVVGSLWIKYFGLAGEIKSYDKYAEKKRFLCKSCNLKLVEIYPRDLFSNNFSKIILDQISG